MNRFAYGKATPISRFWRILGKDMRKHYALYLFLLPGVAAIFIFNYMPMYGVQIAFRNFRPARGIIGSDWVGLKNFERLFNTYKFHTAFMNTIILSLYSLAAGFPMPIIFALILNQVRVKWYKKAVQTISYMPYFISTIVVTGMIRLFLNPVSGLYGQLCRIFDNVAVDFMASPNAFRHIYIISSIWQSLGWSSIIYIAALSNVDTTLYEAATVDGANNFHKIWYIDIPSILPTATILLILSAGGIMNVGFEKAFMLQTDLNINASEIISTYVYKIGLLNSQYSFSAAVDLFNTAINFTLLVLVNAISRRLSENSLW